MSMQEERRFFAGWTVGEALRRACTRTLIDNYFVEKRACRNAGAQLRSTEQALQQLVEQLLDHLSKGQLVAFGRRAPAQCDRVPIPASAWSALQFGDLSASTIIDRSSEQQVLLDVRIYPVLMAPNVAGLINSMALKDVFLRFVLHDPEVQSLSYRAIAADSSVARVYGMGWCYPNGARHWPMMPNAISLAGARELTDPAGFLADRPEAETNRAGLVVTARYRRLLSLLVNGKLVADGDPARSRGLSAIPSSIWSHLHYRVDVSNGDLLEVNDESSIDDPSNRFRVRWRAIMLRTSSPSKHREDSADFRVAAPSVRRVESKSSSRMACQKWLTAEMQNSPYYRPGSKAGYFSQARLKWSDLSRRQFDVAWQIAVLSAPAPAWSAAGAPKKN
jgi:hypothetical protein